ncbi:MAG: alginate export family protein [Planctomycetaceae bacterium]
MPSVVFRKLAVSSMAIACLSLPSLTYAQNSSGLPQTPPNHGTEPIDDSLSIPPAEVKSFSDYPTMPVAVSESGPACSCGGAGVCCDAKKKKALAAKVRDSYKGVFYANDYSYLNDPCYDDCMLGDGLKQLSVPCDGKLDLGGEIRVRYHDEENMRGLGLTGLDDEFWLTRLRLFANYRANDWLRVYGEFIYADSGGEFFNNRNIEENRGDAQNLFVDVTLLQDGDSKLIGRVGRQELIYGNQRLISPLDWANTRRTFDGYKLIYSGANWDIDGFFVNPVNRLLTNEDRWDSADDETDFYGIYSTRKGLDIGTLDFYYLGLDYQVPGASYHTLGSRWAGGHGSWLYEMEKGFQFGENGDGSDHSASYFTAGLGRKLDLCVGGNSWQPTVWGWYDYASGEDTFAESGRFGDGFDHLFPLGHKYLGFMDLFGRRNIQDFNAQLITPVLGDRVSLLVWYHYLLLDELTTPYNINLSPFNTTTAAADRELGHEIDLLLNFAIDARNSALLGYSFFDTGDYFDQTSGGVAGTNGIPTLGDAQFFYAHYQMQF